MNTVRMKLLRKRLVCEGRGPRDIIKALPSWMLPVGLAGLAGVCLALNGWLVETELHWAMGMLVAVIFGPLILAGMLVSYLAEC